MRRASNDDVALEQLLRAIEDDPLWFGYSCGTEHLLDGTGLPKTGEDLRDFLSASVRVFNIAWWDTRKGHSPYDRVIYKRITNWESTWFIETRYGIFKIFSERF